MALDWLRGLLPGVFVDACHWRERAQNAESRLQQVLEQYHTLLTHEREVHATEKAELVKLLLAGNTTQKPPQSAMDDEGELNNNFPSFVQYGNPIQRIQAEARQQIASLEANSISDEDVAAELDAYLMKNARTSVF